MQPIAQNDALPPMTVIPLYNKLEVICVPTEFEAYPTSTASVVVPNVISNGFFTQVFMFIANGICFFAEK